MHETLEKFGYPNTLLKEFEHWSIVMRPSQVTLGSLVLISRSQATSLAALPPPAFLELHRCCETLDRALKSFRSFDKINYLAFMMVDPHVHFHVLPRYASEQIFEGVTFKDVAWPGPPDLKSAPELTEVTFSRLLQALSAAFAKCDEQAIARK